MRHKGSVVRNDLSLFPLVEQSNHLAVSKGRIIGVDLLDVPLNENGIPKREAFVKMVLGTIAVGHYWSGFIDTHHIAWPRASYPHLAEGHEYVVPIKYRECATLKVRVPRQLHNYFHMITSPPPIPPQDVMHQWHLEQDQVDRLYRLIRIPGLNDFQINEYTEEPWRKARYLAKLEKMQDGELGLMPDREILSTLELPEARAALRGLARIKGISNSRQSHRSFFKEIA